MYTYPDTVASQLKTLKDYTASLGTWLANTQNQPLNIDYISIQAVESEAPEAEPGFFENLWYEIKKFYMSFFSDYNSLGATSEEDNSASDVSVVVWTASSRDQAQILRTLVDDNFTPNYEGISVDIQLIAAGTLLPATLAGTGPDIYLGGAQGDPVNYAIRSAVLSLNHKGGNTKIGYDFTDLENSVWNEKDENGEYKYPAFNRLIENGTVKDFNEVKTWFADEALIPVTLYGETYGIPETMSFSMMFYRKDVFAELGLDIPRTWDELMAIVPILQYNNMEVGIPSSSGGLNLLLYQMGGEVYADDGMRIGYDSNISLEAFDTMCSYFTNYGFPVTYDFANRFRTGELPLGFSDYVGSYNQLTIFATEIRDLWEFVPLLGYEDENGVIHNDSLTGVAPMMMMAGIKDEETKQKAWDFMDWFVTADIQAAYANEVVATIGQGAMYATANIEALESLPWATSDYNNIMEQFKSLSAVPEYPGGYIIGRYTNFAFLDAYNNSADPVEALLGYIDDINKEITRKREEFDLETLALGATLAEKRAREAAEGTKE
jgi:ABC-type glycerol-3-phosphate transport system substrate-binding protein